MASSRQYSHTLAYTCRHTIARTKQCISVTGLADHQDRGLVTVSRIPVLAAHLILSGPTDPLTLTGFTRQMGTAQRAKAQQIAKDVGTLQKLYMAF